MKGKIKAIYVGDMSCGYLYRCLGNFGTFSFSVEFRYHMGLRDSEGKVIGREIEYDDEMESPGIRFLD